MTLLEIEHIENGILQLFSKKEEPIGWYAIEQALDISRHDFPDGANVMTFIKKMKMGKLIEEKKDSQGRVGYILTDLGKARVEKISDHNF